MASSLTMTLLSVAITVNGKTLGGIISAALLK
jgi:hypothetical protein